MNEIDIYSLAINPAVAEDFKTSLCSEKAIRLSGHSNTFEEALKDLRLIPIHYDKKISDILFIDDFSFNKHKITDLLSTIHQAGNTKVIIYTDSVDYAYLNNLNISDARGILHKEETPLKTSGTKIIDTIKQVSRGLVWYDNLVRSVISRRHIWARSNNDLIDATAIREEDVRLIKLLSYREKEILLLIAENKQNKEIAAELNIAIGTVEQHKAHLIQKLKLSGAKELSKFAALHRNQILTLLQ